MSQWDDLRRNAEPGRYSWVEGQRLLTLIDAAERAERRMETKREERLETALDALVIDANRLCDRMLGGSYEDDCRRSIARARAALKGGE